MSNVRFDRLGLVQAAKEIVGRLLADDWERRSTADGEHAYYVVGCDAHDLDVNRIHAFNSDFPRRMGSAQVPPLPTLAMWRLRGEVAARQPDYGRLAVDRLLDLGVTPEAVRAIFERRPRFEWNVPTDVEEDTVFQALYDLAAAIAIEKGSAEPEDAEDAIAEDFQASREKYYLERLVEKLPRLVDRSSRLDMLPFEDTHLWEATQCYLFAFNRAAIALAAASVEAHLRDLTGLRGRESTNELLEKALNRGLLDDADVKAAQDVFFIRNRVLHDLRAVEAEETEHLLDLARRVVAQLKSKSSTP